MLLLGLLTPLLGLAAAAPNPNSPSKVKIHGVSLLGSGCPAGSADIQVDATGTLFEATFSQYEVQTGPGTKAIDWRKNCKLTLNMEFDSGFQYVCSNLYPSPPFRANKYIDFPFSIPT